MAPSVLWKPLSVPQANFLAAKEFEVLYGGAKGGKKTESLVVGPLQQTKHPRFKGLLLREVYGELKEIQSRASRIYPEFGATWRADDKQWVFPSGAFVEVGYCENDADVKRYQGREWTYIGYDELGNLRTESTWDLLTAEIRSPDPDLVLMARGSANPGYAGHAWNKRRFIIPTDKGRKVYTRTMAVPNPDGGTIETTVQVRFIPARVFDNPIYANDARYLGILYRLPEARRKQLLDGDWDAAEGLALDELNRDVHWVPRIEVPPHWYVWAAFDWGYAHPWSFVIGAINPKGKAVILDSVHGWRDKPHQIVERIMEHADALFPAHGMKRYDKIVCDPACRQESEAKGVYTPPITDHFERRGIYMWNANNARVFGLLNLNQWLAWRSKKDDASPDLTIADTPGNRILWNCLESIVRDPKHPEDALKTNADTNTGDGGDDPYDALRYLMADRPYVPKEPASQKSMQELHHLDPLNEAFTSIISGDVHEYSNGAWSQLGKNF